MATPRRRLPLSGPAFFIALLALFVALGGTAGAVMTAAVPLAKRALDADKAKVANTAKVTNTAKVALLAVFGRDAEPIMRGGFAASQANTSPSGLAKDEKGGTP